MVICEYAGECEYPGSVSRRHGELVECDHKGEHVRDEGCDMECSYHKESTCVDVVIMDVEKLFAEVVL